MSADSRPDTMPDSEQPITSIMQRIRVILWSPEKLNPANLARPTGKNPIQDSELQALPSDIQRGRFRHQAFPYHAKTPQFHPRRAASATVENGKTGKRESETATFRGPLPFSRLHVFSQSRRLWISRSSFSIRPL